MSSSFLDYYERHAGPVYLKSRRSTLMRLLQFFLLIGDQLGLCAIGDFSRFVTTIGHTIYAEPAWTHNDKPTPILIHELTHVHQWCVLYALRYVFSKKWRLYYEVNCIHASMLCFPKTRTLETCARSAAMLVDYGLDREEAFRALMERKNQVVCTESAVKQIHRLYVGWCHASPF